MFLSILLIANDILLPRSLDSFSIRYLSTHLYLLHCYFSLHSLTSPVCHTMFSTVTAFWLHTCPTFPIFMVPSTSYTPSFALTQFCNMSIFLAIETPNWFWDKFSHIIFYKSKVQFSWDSFCVKLYHNCF